MITPSKKICILTPNHYLFKMGGSEYQIKLILEDLCKKGGNEIYYLCRFSDPSKVRHDYNIINIRGLHALSRYGLFFDTFRVYKALKKIHPDIIYQRVGGAYTGIAAYYAKKFRSKLIWHIASDIDIKGYNVGFGKKYLIDYIERALLNYGIRHANLIIGQTYSQSELLKTIFGKACDRIVYNGQPVSSFKIKKKRKLCVLWIGNIRAIKQPEIFLRAVKKVGRKRDVSFQMIGRSGHGKWSEQILKQISAIDNLEYLGEIPHEQVTKKLCEGHILVNTSDFEGFPNTFIEAWMRGVPVISLNVDPDNILERKKIGFHSRTYNNLCKHLTFLMNNESVRSEMGMRACQYAKTHHSKERMVEGVLELV